MLGVLAAASALAQPLPQNVGERAASVEGIYNDQAGFVVRVDVDHPDRVYVEGDTLRATVKSQRAGYLYLLYQNVQGETVCLFPNRYQADNRIRAEELVQVPAPGANYRIRIHAPLGREVLKAVVSPKPLSAQELRVETLSAGVAQPVTERGVRDARVELVTATPARDWAEHQVELRTVPSRAPVKQAARYGAIVAVGKYQDPKIRPLAACAKDAELMKKLFQDYGRMDDIVVLQDERATRRGVEKLFQILAQGTKPGDEIFIYWTGHGASVADTNGDEGDGLDEVLVTFDAARDDVGRTGVLDDVLRRWVQDLDGRRLVFIADTCLAGGFAGTGKGVEQQGVEGKSLFDELQGEAQPAGAATTAAKSGFDFFDSEFVQTKDIGQKETAVLCSSADKEVSLVRRDGASSVMTGFLADFVRQGAQAVSLKAAYEHVKVEVPKYVRDRFPGLDQQPQLLDNLTAPVYLRP
jgi:hypothetical protein